jgi:hypothetical protein
MDHSLPPLGLFLQIQLNFLSLSQTNMLKHKERYFTRNPVLVLDAKGGENKAKAINGSATT